MDAGIGKAGGRKVLPIAVAVDAVLAHRVVVRRQKLLRFVFGLGIADQHTITLVVGDDVVGNQVMIAVTH